MVTHSIEYCEWATERTLNRTLAESIMTNA